MEILPWGGKEAFRAAGKLFPRVAGRRKLLIPYHQAQEARKGPRDTGLPRSGKYGSGFACNADVNMSHFSLYPGKPWRWKLN